MAKKRPSPVKPALVTKLLKFPSDWVERIDAQRGEESFSDFVRRCVLNEIGNRGLSEMPGWGKWERPK
jgi:hypothetical protein